MKKTILSDIHKSLGAKMVEFAGFYMPVQYEGVTIEHNLVRNHVGIFDVSHMGEIFITGKDSLEFLQYVTSNDVSKLDCGKVQYTYLPNDIGGVIDDCLLYMLEKNKYLLVVNASNIDKVLLWLQKYNNFNDCIIVDQSSNYSLFAIQGPKSIKLLQNLTKVKLDEVKYYNFVIGNILDIDNIIISRTGYTGELGFELYIKNEYAERVWNIIFNTSIKIHPIGLAARNTLRLEKGFCLYGNDIDENTSPIEAGLGWITNFNKEFINSVKLRKQTDNGIKRKLIGLKMIDKGIARKDYPVLDNNSNDIGVVTSGTISPTLGEAIAMAYILVEKSEIGSEVLVKVRNKMIKAEIVSLPFL